VYNILFYVSLLDVAGECVALHGGTHASASLAR
jgi:hypothetical protein